MKNRYVAMVAAAALLVGGGSAYAYIHHAPAPKARTVAATAPLDPAGRDLAAYKGTASAKGAARHAKATVARKAREAAARRAAQTPSNVGQPCNGDPSSWQEWQPDGTCSGPIHRGGGGYYDNDGNPCPGASPCTDAPGYQDDNTNNDPMIKTCQNGAATSRQCDQLLKHGEPNMAPPKCGDGSTPAYLRAHGVHC